MPRDVIKWRIYPEYGELISRFRDISLYLTSIWPFLTKKSTEIDENLQFRKKSRRGSVRIKNLSECVDFRIFGFKILNLWGSILNLNSKI